MFVQLNKPLLLSKMMKEDSSCRKLCIKKKKTDILMLDEKRTVRAQREFVCQNCQLMSRSDKFKIEAGLKKELQQ